MLDQFFGATMKEADMGIDPLNDLAIEFQHETQHAVRCRVYRPKIDGKLAIGGVGHVRLDQL